MSNKTPDGKTQRAAVSATREAALAGGAAAFEQRRTAEAEKTVRLRALRLAKEEADRIAAANEPKVRRKS